MQDKHQKTVSFIKSCSLRIPDNSPFPSTALATKPNYLRNQKFEEATTTKIMPTAEGIVKSTSGVRLIASFVVGGSLYNFFGVSSISFPEFRCQCNTATLRYSDISDLTSTRAFTGTIGPSDLEFGFANGPTITGQLDKATPSKMTISGSGTWTLN